MASRRGRTVDYSAFAAGGDGDSDYEDTPSVDFSPLYSELLRWKNYRQGAVKRAAPTAFTADWLQKNGAFRPTIFPSLPQDTFLRLPPGAENLTLEVLSEAVGQAKQVQTFDVTSQTDSSNRWTMYQWSMYWTQRTGQGGPFLYNKSPQESAGKLKGVTIADVKRLTALPCLPVAGTGLEKHITVPHPNTAVDLAGSTLPQSTYVAMYPSGTFINFQMASCGASLWIWLDKGAATLALIPPTAGNLTAYATWARDGQRRAGINLAASCEGVARADLTAGDMLMLPPEWCYALLATDNSVAVAGTFLRADSMALHVEALRIEEFLSMPSLSTPAVALHRQKTKKLLWQVAARYASSLETKVVQRDPAFSEQVTARAAEMEREDRATAAIKRAALARHMTAASTRALGEVGRSRLDAGGSRAQRPPIGRDGAKRRRRDSLAFLASDSEGQSGSEEDEKEWRPEVQGIGNLASESDLDFDEGSDDGSESFDSDEGETLRQHKGHRKRQAAKMKQPVTNVGTSTRFKGRMPAKLAAVLYEGEDEEGVMNEFEWGGKEEGVSERIPNNVVAPSPTPLKLKINLNTGGTTGATITSATAAAPSKLKLKLKAPAAPQGDVEICWAGTVPEELSEGEEQGLAALIVALREWLCAPDGLESVPPSVPAPWEVVARLELGMTRLGLSLEVPIRADLGPEPSFGGASPIEEPLISAIQSEGEEEGGETAPEDASAVNRAVIEESAGPKPRPPVQRPTPASAGGAKRGVKKLSTKDRLKKKLGL